MGPFILSTLAITLHLQASISLENQFIKMELPNSWTCQEIETRWICQDKNRTKFKPQITLEMKNKTQKDFLTNFFTEYRDYLEKTKIRIFNGKKYTSEIKNIKKSIINNIEWIDSLHLNREALEHYTRYLITQQNNQLISLSLSAHQSVYSEYVYIFLHAIQTLEIKGKLWENNPETESIIIASSLDDHKHDDPLWGMVDFIIFVTLAFLGYIGYIRFKKRQKL